MWFYLKYKTFIYKYDLIDLCKTQFTSTQLREIFFSFLCQGILAVGLCRFLGCFCVHSSNGGIIGSRSDVAKHPSVNMSSSVNCSFSIDSAFKIPLYLL